MNNSQCEFSCSLYHKNFTFPSLKNLNAYLNVKHCFLEPQMCLLKLIQNLNCMYYFSLP